MQEVRDTELLRQYVRQNSEKAFTALVTRHLNMVYSAALRKTGNPAAAEEITQAVFIILARKADELSRHAALSGWLYQTTRLTAGNFLRTEIRRARREQGAYMQSLSNQTESEIWPQIMPLLEDAMGRLGEKDRNALALRFFEGKSFQEIGIAFGASENAAKKRVAHALEKLRNYFSKHGVTSTTATIAGAISANSIQIAPAALIKTTTAVALTKGAATSISILTLVKAVTIKSAATFGAGSIGGLFATIGSACVSLKARADDSKSPRERQFMLRMFRKRMTGYLIWVAMYFIAAKCDWFQKPICFDFFAAAFAFYFLCIDWMIFGREQGLRRRQIQIEDKTYVEAEWTQPRRVTDPTVNAFNAKNMLKAFRFGIFRMILACTIWFQLGFGHTLYIGWKVRSQHPVAEVVLIITLAIAAALFALSPYTQLLSWKKFPRFMPIRGDGKTPRGFLVFPIMFPIMIGLLTLAIFGIHQHWADDGRHDSLMLEANQVLVFFVVVVAVYTAFTIRTIGILAKRRKNDNQG